MKQFLLILLFSISLIAVEIDQDIIDVEIYNNGAYITKNIIVKNAADTKYIFIPYLPNSINENSISVVAIEKVNFISKKIKQFNHTDIKKIPEIVKTQEKINEKKENVDYLSAQISLNKRKLDTIFNIAKFNENQISKTINTNTVSSKTVNDLMDIIDNNGNKINTKILELQNKVVDVQKDIKELQKYKNYLIKKFNRLNKYYVIQFKSDLTNFEFKLKYFVGNVWWKSFYKSNFIDKKDINFYLYANIHNNSGEDWDNVKLTLFTKTIDFNVSIPKFQPHYLNKIEFLSNSKRYSASAPLPMLTSTQVPPEESADAMAKSEVKMAEENAISDKKVLSGNIVYIIDKNVTIPSTYEYVTLLIDKFHFVPERIEYICDLTFNQNIYIKTSFTNKTNINLLAGNINIYNDDIYIGQSHTDNILPGDTVILFLGKLKEVKIQKLLVSKKTNEKTILTNNKETEYSYRITISNLDENNYRIKIIDRLPVSQNKDIQIENKQFNVHPYIDSELGKMIWTLNSEPKSTTEYYYSYDIIHPFNWRINFD